MKVAIIPGHGGFDPGACNKNTGAIEAKGNLAVALKLDQLLRNHGIDTVLSRASDVACGGAKTVKDDVNNQIRFANSSGADVAIAIHGNSAVDKTAHGVEVLYTNYPVQSSQEIHLGNLLLEELVKVTGMANRGLKETPKGVGVIKYVNIPCVLSENGFVSNDQESAWCTDEDKQWIIAEAHAKAICRYFGVEYKGRGEDALKPAEDWKTALLNKAKSQGLISGLHHPDDPVPYWAMCAVALKVLEKGGK